MTSFRTGKEHSLAKNHWQKYVKEKNVVAAVLFFGLWLVF